jgi:hypothetical protein
MWLLWLAIGIPLATVPLIFLDGLSWHIAGWALAIFGTLALIWTFTVIDLKRRLLPFIDNPGTVSLLRITALIVALVVGMGHAYLIADEVSRWDMFA